jgi:hypothetical protein
MMMMMMTVMTTMNDDDDDDDDDDDGDNTLQLTNKWKLVVVAASKYPVPGRIIQCFYYVLQ